MGTMRWISVGRLHRVSGGWIGVPWSGLSGCGCCFTGLLRVDALCPRLLRRWWDDCLLHPRLSCCLGYRVLSFRRAHPRLFRGDPVSLLVVYVNSATKDGGEGTECVELFEWERTEGRRRVWCVECFGELECRVRYVLEV